MALLLCFMKIAPLKGSFLLLSLVGFLISVFYITPLNSSWGFAFGFVFTLMFIASMISTMYGPAEDELGTPRVK